VSTGAGRFLAWTLLAVWAVWLFALHAWLAGESAAARWWPDLGLVLCASLAARIESRDVPLCALVFALARSAVGSEPPIVVLAGFSGALALLLVARSVVELTSPPSRALAAGLLVLAFDAWLIGVHRVRLGAAAADWPVGLLAGWTAALSSAVLAFVLGPALAHLPGLTPLRRRRW
jgi:hypothetical protein